MDPNTHHNALNQNSRLHWYEIQSILGQGGFGITYLGYDTNLQQKVAIKEYLPTEFSTRDASNTVQPISTDHSKIFKWGLSRFLEEAQTLAKFKHNNIVRVQSFFEENNTAYMIMEYEEGTDLATMISNGEHFSEQRILGLLLPILDGLAKVHESGFIHRDIKPANIFIRADGSPVLIDFGSARHAMGGQTRTMTSLVTPGYAPFEQYHDAEGKQGPWTDVYSLSATCYCAITGKAPPDALKRGMMQFEHNTDIYLPLVDVQAGKYAEHLLEAIDCGMRFKASERPQTIPEWSQMLTGQIPVPKVEAPVVDTAAAKTALADVDISLTDVFGADGKAPQVDPSTQPTMAHPSMVQQPASQVPQQPVSQPPPQQPVSQPPPQHPASQVPQQPVSQPPPQQPVSQPPPQHPASQVPQQPVSQPPPQHPASQVPQQPVSQPPPQDPASQIPQQPISQPPPQQPISQPPPEHPVSQPSPYEETVMMTQPGASAATPPPRKRGWIGWAAALVVLAGIGIAVVVTQVDTGQSGTPELVKDEPSAEELAALEAEKKRVAEMAKEVEEIKRQTELAKQEAEAEKKAQAKAQAEREKQAEIARQKADEKQQSELDKQKAALAKQKEELAKQKADLAKQKAERERQAKLAKEKAERERQAKLAREKAERERQAKLAKEKAERERQAKLAREKAERERQQRLAQAESDRAAKVRAQLAVADGLFNKKSYEQARLNYERVLDLNPNNNEIDQANSGIEAAIAAIEAEAKKKQTSQIRYVNLSGKHQGRLRYETNRFATIGLEIAEKGNQISAILTFDKTVRGATRDKVLTIKGVISNNRVAYAYSSAAGDEGKGAWRIDPFKGIVEGVLETSAGKKFRYSFKPSGKIGKNRDQKLASLTLSGQQARSYFQELSRSGVDGNLAPALSGLYRGRLNYEANKRVGLELELRESNGQVQGKLILASSIRNIARDIELHLQGVAENGKIAYAYSSVEGDKGHGIMVYNDVENSLDGTVEPFSGKKFRFSLSRRGNLNSGKRQELTALRLTENESKNRLQLYQSQGISDTLYRNFTGKYAGNVIVKNRASTYLELDVSESGDKVAGQVYIDYGSASGKKNNEYNIKGVLQDDSVYFAYTANGGDSGKGVWTLDKTRDTITGVLESFSGERVNFSVKKRGKLNAAGRNKIDGQRLSDSEANAYYQRLLQQSGG